MGIGSTQLRRCFCGALAAVLLLAAQAAADSAVQWHQDVERAMQLAARTDRLVLLHFWGRSCEPCLHLDRQVYNQPRFAAWLETHFVPVKVDVEMWPKTVQRFGVTRYPTDVVLTPAGDIVSKTGCPADVDSYIAHLGQIAGSHREQIARSAPPASTAASASTDSRGGHAARPAAASQDLDSRSRHPQERFATAVAPSQPSPSRRPEYDGDSGSSSAAHAGPGRYDARYDGDDAYLQARQTDPRSQDSPPGTASHPSPTTLQSARSDTRGAQFQPPRVDLGPPAAQSDPAAGSSASAMHRAERPQGDAADAPPSHPPLGLEGYCPVHLIERMQWKQGDVRWGAIHRGRTYLFTGEEEQRRFLADPDRYSPVLSGFDPVLWLDQQQFVPGTRRYGVLCGERIYLFATEETRTAFERGGNRYIQRVQEASK
jgi:YHS domain-containing protein/thiol-disulfide isomerase/thioredoxin